MYESLLVFCFLDALKLSYSVTVHYILKAVYCRCYAMLLLLYIYVFLMYYVIHDVKGCTKVSTSVFFFRNVMYSLQYCRAYFTKNIIYGIFFMRERSILQHHITRPRL